MEKRRGTRREPGLWVPSGTSDTARQVLCDRYCVTDYDAAPRATVDKPPRTNEQYE